MDIEPVNDRKKLFINPFTNLYRKSENSRRQKKILDWWSESQGENFSRDFWPSWFLN